MLRIHSNRCRQSLQLRGGHGRTAGRFATRCSFGTVNLDQVALAVVPVRAILGRQQPEPSSGECCNAGQQGQPCNDRWD